jgi:YidC/Oxa1 family membrane protein insertase
MEKRMFVAVGLSMLILITWPMIFGEKKQVLQEQVIPQEESVKKQTISEKKLSEDIKSTKVLKRSFKEKLYYIENDSIKLELSSIGAKIKQVWFKNYKDSTGNYINFFSNLVSEQGGLIFPEMNNIEFLSSTNSGKDLLLENKEHGAKIHYSVSDDNPYVLELMTSFAKHAQTTMSFRDIAGGSSRDYSFPSNASDRFKEYIIYTKNKAERISIKEDSDEAILFESKANWLALSDKYFMISAVSDKDTWFGDIVANRAEDKFHITTFNVMPQLQSNHYRLFVGPKDLNYLRHVDASLSEAIDHGWFAVISVPMLELMKFFYRVIPNYGVAILLLTLLVRLIMFPLQHKSMKSMKKMQELQPYLKSLQEKYKNDKEKLNKEMMQFMKTHKVNPMGGCLPMLLQLPVFIALYKVLGNAVELYKSPFIFWITDLSSKDPYYVLPILMGIMMFLQQKMMPNPTMDPTQAKMMMFFLPVIFTIFMLGLPSGLTLYIMFSTLLGIVQQYIMNKNKVTS